MQVDGQTDCLFLEAGTARLQGPQSKANPSAQANLKGIDANQSAFLLRPISLSPTFQNPLFYHCVEGALILFRRVGADSDS